MAEAVWWRAQPAKRLGGLFGRAKAATGDLAEDARDAVEKAPRKPLFGGFGTKRVRVEEPEEEPQTNPLASLFGGGKKVSFTNPVLVFLKRSVR